jgi:hypothetical protein
MPKAIQDPTWDLCDSASVPLAATTEEYNLVRYEGRRRLMLLLVLASKDEIEACTPSKRPDMDRQDAAAQVGSLGARRR